MTANDTLTQPDRTTLADRIAAALGDGWCMDDEDDKAAAVAAVMEVIDEQQEPAT